MNLARTSLLNGVAVSLKLATNLLLNKLLAVQVGPAGYGVLGQFQSLVTLVTALSGSALGNGVIQATAAHHDAPERQRAVWRTAAAVGGAAALLIGLGLWLAREPLAAWALGDRAYADVISWLAASLVLMVANALLLAILNGRKAVVAMVQCQIVGNLATAAFAAFMVMQGGLKGALIALATGQSLALLATLVIFGRSAGVPWRDLAGRIDRDALRGLGNFALMGLAGAVIMPVTQLIVRDGLVATQGWAFTGLWQAMNKISELHLMLMVSTFSVYLLPTLAAIRDGEALRAEIGRSLRFVFALVAASALAIWLLREWLVALLMSASFLPMTDAMGIQLIGDVLKITSWVLAYTMISHGRTLAFIATELAFALMLVASTAWLSAVAGLRGAAAAYALSYAVYGVIVYLLYRRLARELSAPAKALGG